MVMWQQFDLFEEGSNYAAWAVAIARNQVFNYVKSQKRHRRCFNLDTMEVLAESAETPSKTDDRLEALRHCITKLPGRDAQLLALRYEMGATIKGVAEQLGQSLNTMYHRLYRVRIGLLQCIERQLARDTR